MINIPQVGVFCSEIAKTLHCAWWLHFKMVDLSSFVATFLEQHHHEDSAAPVDQGLPGDVGGLDPDQDQAEAPPAGQPHQGER